MNDQRNEYIEVYVYFAKYLTCVKIYVVHSFTL